MTKYGEYIEPGVISEIDSELEISLNFGSRTDFSDEVGSLGQGSLGTQSIGVAGD